MDEQNGECSDHPNDMYSSINPLDLLLEPHDSTRNVPCSTLNTDIDGSDILNNCIEMKSLPQHHYAVDSGYGNCTDAVNSSKVNTSEHDIPNNCTYLFRSPDHDSSLRNLSNLGLSVNFEDGEQSKTYTPCSLDSTGDEGRTADNASIESEITEQSDDMTTVQTSLNDDIQSTKYAEVNAEGDLKTTAIDSEYNSQDTQDEESDDKERGMDNGHHSGTASGSKPKAGSSRGRKRKSGDDGAVPKAKATSSVKKRQPAVTYHSQISPDQNGIKLKIKKSSGATNVQKPVKRRDRAKKRRSKKDDDDEDSEMSKEQNGEQSRWGVDLPIHVLVKIFSSVTQEEGCLPFLVRATSVCRLWREAALSPSLWHNIDLTGPWVHDRYKSEAQLAWLCEHRLTLVEELNVGGWKVADKLRVVRVMTEQCKNLRGINLAGWNGMNGEHLKYLVDHCDSLSRIDLSSISPDGNITRSAVSMMAIRHMCQTMGGRLTHLVLANNRITGIAQIVTVIAENCPNLEVFDISNMWGHSIIPLNVEKLQEGCQKLRVLRFSNSHLCLAPASLKEQVASPGFPFLEELSVASIFGLDGSMQRPIMDDNSVERILKTSHKLRLLDVRGCSRISDSSLVRVPAWDLEHLFLSGCYVTKMASSGLELIVQKWSHSLVEMDLAWSTATEPLDSAVTALAERAEESPLRILNLCGSSVSLEPVKAVLMQCPRLESLNLSSCRALPRGMKRLYEGYEVTELRRSLQEKAESENSASASPSDTPPTEAAEQASADALENASSAQEQPEATMPVDKSEPDTN